MSFYSQWIKDTKLSSVVWVCGSEQVLIDEVVSYVKSSWMLNDMNFSIIDARQSSNVWDELWQRPLMEDFPRLVLVLNAQELTDLTPMKSWLSEFKTSFPQTTVCFVSEDDAPPEVDFLKPPKVTVVRCSRLSVEDSVKWVKRQTPLSERSARLLLDHVAGSLEDAKQVCDKINRALDVSSLLNLTSEQIKAFISETPSDFVDALMCLDKERALTTVSLLSMDERYKVVSTLEFRLSQLAKLQRLLKREKLTGQALSKIPGIPYPVVKDLLLCVKFYNDSRIIACRQQLTLADHYHNQGVYSGVLESLIALW